MMDQKNNTTIVLRKQSPKQITNFGHKAAKQLIAIVKQSNDWVSKIEGKDYLKYEAWQTLARFFGYTVKTEETKYVEYGEAKGFEAKSIVLDSNGQEIGGAEAVCLNDEENWQTERHTNKWGKEVPGRGLFALKAMAQTRAAGRALRQILSWVVVLAGYNPALAEEMVTELVPVEDVKREQQIDTWKPGMASDAQKKMIFALGNDLKFDSERTKEIVKTNFKLEHFDDLTMPQAKTAIEAFQKKIEQKSFDNIPAQP